MDRKVGELARRTGLSVRTLRFYDEIGLLAPSDRTDAGHRLYTADDVARLQRIVSLRSLGFTLEEIGDLLDGREGTPAAVVDRHLRQVRTQIALARRLEARLVDLAGRLDSAGADVDDLLDAIGETVDYERYYTEAQIAALEQRRREIGDEGVARHHAEWAEVVALARAELARGTPADDPAAQEIARRWRALIEQFTGGDPGIRDGLARLWRENGDWIGQRIGIDRELGTWVGRAMASLG